MKSFLVRERVKLMRKAFPYYYKKLDQSTFSSHLTWAKFPVLVNSSEKGELSPSLLTLKFVRIILETWSSTNSTGLYCNSINIHIISNYVFQKLGFFLCKAEQSLWGMDLQEEKDQNNTEKLFRKTLKKKGVY